MMYKGPKQQSFDIRTIPFYNDYSINSQLENTGNISVPMQTKSPLNSVVYPISEANSSTPYKLLTHFK